MQISSASVVIVVTVTPSVAVPTISAVVIVAVNLAPIVANLLSLITYFILVLARFALVALTDLVMTTISQVLQLALVLPQSFPLPVIAGRVVVGERARARNDQSSGQ